MFDRILLTQPLGNLAILRIAGLLQDFGGLLESKGHVDGHGGLWLSFLSASDERTREQDKGGTQEQDPHRMRPIRRHARISEGPMMPPETTVLSASSIVHPGSRTCASRTMTMNPEVGLGGVGMNTLSKDSSRCW